DPAADKEWIVRLNSVPLDAGTTSTEIRLWISDRAGQWLEPATASVRYKPRLPAPEVEFLDPRESSVVYTSRLKVRLHVRSASRLQRLEVIREGDKAIPVDVTALQPNAQGTYE